MGPRSVSRPAVWAGASAPNLSVPGHHWLRNKGGRDPQPGGAIPSFGTFFGAASRHDQTNSEDAMTKRHEAKYKIDRRMGQNIWGRPKSPINKREYGPGQHGQRRKGK